MKLSLPLLLATFLAGWPLSPCTAQDAAQSDPSGAGGAPLKRMPEPALPPGSALVFGPDDDVIARLVQVIDATEKELLVGCYAISDPRVYQAILGAYAKRHVFTVVIVEPDAGKEASIAARELAKRGVPIFIRPVEGGYYNQRLVLADRQTLILTTADFATVARRNAETLLMTAEPALVARAYNRLMLDLRDSAPIQADGAAKDATDPKSPAPRK